VQSCQLHYYPCSHAPNSPSSFRFCPIALKPPITTTTPIPHSLLAPICQSTGPLSANLSIIPHTVSV
jgi:hypothetical protein